MIIRDKETVEKIETLKEQGVLIPISKIEDYIIYKNTENEKLFVLGNKLIDPLDLEVIELVISKGSKEYIEMNLDPSIYRLDIDDSGYIVGFLTIKALSALKYSGNLNIISFYFKERENALLFLSVFADYLYEEKEKKFKKLKEEFQNVSNEEESGTASSD